ncbi:hypothetical protein [Lysobacter sp. HA35]
MNRHNCLTRALPAVLFVLGTVAALPAFAREGCTQGPRCWYVIFGTGDTPKRDLFLARRVGAQDGDERRVAVTQVFETPSPSDYVTYSIAVRCGTRQIKVERMFAAATNSQFMTKDNVLDWRAAPQSWIQRAVDFACDPAAQSSPERLQMSFFSEIYRDVDAAALARQAFWQEMLYR